MGTDLDGRDLGPGIDQLPSGMYRLRTMLHSERISEVHESLDYLGQLADKIELMRKLQRPARIRQKTQHLDGSSDEIRILVPGLSPQQMSQLASVLHATLATVLGTQDFKVETK